LCYRIEFLENTIPIYRRLGAACPRRILIPFAPLSCLPPRLPDGVPDRFGYYCPESLGNRMAFLTGLATTALSLWATGWRS